jgi:hypothetical protein
MWRKTGNWFDILSFAHELLATMHSSVYSTLASRQA